MDSDEINGLLEFLSTEKNNVDFGSLQDGEIVGNWRVLAYLGGGGSAEVYRVMHMHVNLKCALKIARTVDMCAKRRILQEAEILAGGIAEMMPRFYEFGEYDGRPYIVMELLEPKDLPVREVGIVRLLRDICSALKHLHAAGFVHGDIKPANVLYRKTGEAVLCDFGTARPIDSSCASVTKEGKIVVEGTLGYAAPEQLAGLDLGAGADIHALGVFIDACFRGRPNRKWTAIIQRATSSLPNRRYKTIDALMCAIKWRYAKSICLLLCIVVSLIIGLTFRQIRHTDEMSGLKSKVRINMSENLSEWISR